MQSLSQIVNPPIQTPGGKCASVNDIRASGGVKTIRQRTRSECCQENWRESRHHTNGMCFIVLFAYNWRPSKTIECHGGGGSNGGTSHCETVCYVGTGGFRQKFTPCAWKCWNGSTASNGWECTIWSHLQIHHGLKMENIVKFIQIIPQKQKKQKNWYSTLINSFWFFFIRAQFVKDGFNWDKGNRDEFKTGGFESWRK